MTVAHFHTRWARPDEHTQIRSLTTGIFDPGVPLEDSWITHTVDDVLRGHPQANVADYAVAVDDDVDEVIGGAVLFEQPWQIGRTTVMMGRPELVVTSPTHRGQGVMRAVLDMLHRRSHELGHTAQCITGVPSVYRHLGYGYTHPLGAGREILHAPEQAATLPETAAGSLRFSDASPDDVAEADALLVRDVRDVDVSTPQSMAYLEYAVTRQDPASRRGPRNLIGRDAAGALCAVVQLERSPEAHAHTVTAAAISSNADPLAVAAGVLRTLTAEPAAHLETSDPAQQSVVLALGDTHFLYDALTALGVRHIPFDLDRWYLRIEEPAAFLQEIRAELDYRLQHSVFRRHSGILLIDGFASKTTLTIRQGHIESVSGDGSDTPASSCTIRVAPDQLAALFIGSRTVNDLMASTPETHPANNLARELTRVLFPRLRARTVPLN